jgi:hypothetical protein
MIYDEEYRDALQAGWLGVLRAIRPYFAPKDLLEHEAYIDMGAAADEAITMIAWLVHGEPQGETAGGIYDLTEGVALTLRDCIAYFSELRAADKMHDFKTIYS